MSFIVHSVGGIGNIPYIAWTFVSILLAVCGVLVMSTVPLEDCDWDELVQRKPWMRYATFLILSLFALAAADAPPYVAFLLLFITLGIVVNKWRFTFWVSLYFYFWFQCIWPACFRAAMFASDPDQGVLAGQVFTNLHSSRLNLMWWSLGGYIILAEILFAAVLYRMYIKYRDTPHGGTLLFYISVYGWITVASTMLIIEFILITLTGGPEFSNISERTSLFAGIGTAFPLVLLLAIGRERVFNIMAERFDSDKDRLEQDGAFIAGLLDTEFISLRHAWWVHRDVKDMRFPENDHRHHWIEGSITDINDTHFVVHCVDGRTTELERGLKCDNLLKIAKENLRCIEWTSIKRGLLNGSIRSDDVDCSQLYSCSRPLRPGERIDFFMSHSWSDNGDMKYEKMCELAKAFHVEQGRHPTFWFDKVKWSTQK